ncbi:MAG TPA: methionine synthase [Thermoanaerobaculaceae bacterium]|nr:methionine synthase [Thermoanaerobaculaceae bacterium]HRS15036.1 methionine synthase [Thermoanaerobaculaceae bacterium]
MSENPRTAALRRALGERILVLDGATGTALAALGLWAADYGGEEYLGCHEALLLHRPQVILDLHRGYLAAGADILETDSFGGTPIVLAEYGLADHAEKINAMAAALARRVAGEAEARDGRPRWVAGAMGPTTRSLTLTGGVTFAEMVAAYRRQVEGLAEGGVDVLLVETVQDALNLKAALIACRDAAPGVPVAASATIEPTGTTLGGQTIEAIAAIAAPWEPLWLGINCSTGPGPMAEHVRALAAIAPCAVAVCPNAGLPDPEGRYLETPEEFSRVLERFASEGWINLLGGCCGTGVAHVRALRAVADRRAPRRPVQAPPARLAGGEAVEIRQSPAPLLIGERTNALGSRKFRELVRSGRFAEAAEIGRRQVRGGAHVVDVCVADPEADERALVEGTLLALRRAVRVPIMIDSTDPDVIARALELIPGRPVINSVNLEDGGARLEAVAGLARRFGAAVVAGCIDEHPSEGMARTAERKLEVAGRLLERLAACGVPASDVLVDPLVFPAVSGDARFAGAAAETVQGVRLIKERFPQAHTLLGISNVSFGLAAAGREVLNAVLLHHAVQAGLDAAIVNTEQLVRFPAIPPEEAALAEAVLFEGSKAAVDAFAARFRAARPRAAADDAALPAEERLRRMVVEGRRSGLEAVLDELLGRMDPLEIINGPLLEGMDEVGRLFGSGQLIVAEVLVSAEVMQAAVARLEPHLGAAEAASRGSMLLATVRGDVHDIGKSLVSIIFSSNGYRIVDLGVQCPSERLVAAWREHRTDLIGLSGLLVRSAHQMAATAADLAAAGIDVPMLVGGAALSSAFTRQHIAPAYTGPVRYAPDAMAGLAIAQEVLHTRPTEKTKSHESTEHRATNAGGEAGQHATGRAVTQQEEAVPRVAAAVLETPARESGERPSSSPRPPVPPPPDLVRHVLPELPLDDVFAHLNWQMLLGKHLGVRGAVKRLLEAHDVRVEEVARRVEALQDAAATRKWLQPAAVYQFYRAIGRGDEVVVLDAAGRELAALPFARQTRPPHACAADWVSPDPDARDAVALFVTTTGTGVRERADELRAAGRLADSIALQALALETAEAAAEWLHRRLRALWGFPDPPEMTMEERFRAAYRGIRLSFGYPACPAIEPQAELFRLLEPDIIGVQLTEGYMMEPEASVSAVVFHHPEGRYLS